MIKKLFRPDVFFIAGIGVAALFVVFFTQQQYNKASAQVDSSLIQPMYFVDEPINIFSAYQSWHSSSVLKTTDALGQALFAMGFENDYNKTPQSAFDINGDGLVDIVHHVRQNTYTQSELAVFLNKGNIQFDIAYKCLVHRELSIVTYYGDCAE